MSEATKIEYYELIDVEIDACPSQYPEFEDAYISKAYLRDGSELRELTSKEYDFVNEKFAGQIQERAYYNFI